MRTAAKNQVLRTRLQNGLKVRLKEIHTAPLVSCWVWYRVGSKDERPGQTGASHWVEHMQFKGTRRHSGAELERVISRDGGFWNAFTWLDWTAYFETMPADRIDLALRLEADRMRTSLFDPKEVEAERTVIMSERQGNENEPTFRLAEEIQSAAFRVHPYHHEVIGDMADLESMTRDDLYHHYRNFYRPNNAVLVVAGDFQRRPMLERVRRLFGSIPPRQVERMAPRPEPEQHGERRLTLEGPGKTAYLEVAYHAPRGADAAFFPLAVLDSALAGASSLNLFGGGLSNKTSRLYRALVERGLAASVSGDLATTIDPYLYSFRITVRPEHSPEKVLAAFDQEIDRLLEAPIASAEIEKAGKQARALFAFGSESITNQAFWQGYSEMFADHIWFEDYLARIQAVTVEQVVTVAQQVLRQANRVVGVYLPSGEGADAS
ncbi:MAG: insulinase family protein [Anaerolineales bacterium]|nr:insulinase family protein [Anaerolineales bacterium]